MGVEVPVLSEAHGLEGPPHVGGSLMTPARQVYMTMCGSVGRQTLRNGVRETKWMGFHGTGKRPQRTVASTRGAAKSAGKRELKDKLGWVGVGEGARLDLAVRLPASCIKASWFSTSLWLLGMPDNGSNTRVLAPHAGETCIESPACAGLNQSHGQHLRNELTDGRSLLSKLHFLIN